MKAIVYVSVHHGNTKKIVDAIANECEVELIDAMQVKEKDLSAYESIGFASGVYGFNLHKELIKFAEKNLPINKRIFIISTSATNKDFSDSFIKSVGNKAPVVMGKFSCFGYNTFGPFKLVGGTSKGHPDNQDLENAVAFFNGLE